MADFVLNTKVGAADDSLPSVVPPAANRILNLPKYADEMRSVESGSLAVFFQPKTAGGALVTDGSLSAQLFVKDGISGQWVAVGPEREGIAPNEVHVFDFPQTVGHDLATLRLRSISGTSPGVPASVDCYYSIAEPFTHADSAPSREERGSTGWTLDLQVSPVPAVLLYLSARTDTVFAVPGTPTMCSSSTAKSPL